MRRREKVSQNIKKQNFCKARQHQNQSKMQTANSHYLSRTTCSVKRERHPRTPGLLPSLHPFSTLPPPTITLPPPPCPLSVTSQWYLIFLVSPHIFRKEISTLPKGNECSCSQQVTYA
jgi:hypothetical protein